MSILELPKEVRYLIVSLSIENSLTYFTPMSVKLKNTYTTLPVAGFSEEAIPITIDKLSCVLGVTLDQLLEMIKKGKGPTWSVIFDFDGKKNFIGSQQCVCSHIEKERLLEGLKIDTFSLLSCVTVSSDGSTLFTEQQGEKACLWDTKTGQFLQELIGKTGTLHSVAFSPDGNSILIGSDDTTAKLWDIKTGRLVQVLSLHSAPVIAVAFGSDSSSIITLSKTGTIILWKRFSAFSDWTKEKRKGALIRFKIKEHLLF